MSDKTTLGDRMKTYEATSTSRKAFKGQPIIVRLDGKSFHKFTSGMERPFDSALTAMMIDLTKALVDKTGANFGYTQSDEITLGFFIDSTSKAEYMFDGRFQKMESVIAGMATGLFLLSCIQHFPERVKMLPVFDCRAFVVPNLLEAYHSVLWRQQDCTKNAISMAAQSMFSHKSLQGLNGSEMQEKMWAEKNVNFNDYPASFRRGTFARRLRTFEPLDAAVIEKLTALGKPVPEAAERSKIVIENAWLTKLDNPVAYLFKNGPETYRTDAILEAIWVRSRPELNPVLEMPQGGGRAAFRGIGMTKM